MALGSTKPLIEMNTRSLPREKGGRRVRLATSPPSVSQFLENVGASTSQKTYGPPRPVTGIALPSTVKKTNRDSAVGIAFSYGVDGRGVRVRVPGGSKIFLVLIDSEAHPASYRMNAHSLGVKWLGRDTDHSPPTSAEVKKTWIYTSTPPYVFMV
jgi:hypothetical protein